MATTNIRRQAGARGGAAAILKRQQEMDEDYTTPNWMILFGTYALFSLIFFLFTPYTHQLDEIKNTLLYSFTPFLLAVAIWRVDFSRFTWKTHATSLLLGLYTAAMVLSWIVNPYKLVGERILWFQVACVTFTCVFAWFMDSENKMRKTMMFIVLVALASTVIGLILYANIGIPNLIYNFGKSAGWSQEWVTLFYTLASPTAKEMYSTILNSDFFAAFLVMTIPLTLAMFFVEEHLLFKAIAVATFLLMNICLLFTNSIDSFLSMITSYILFLVLAYLYVKNWNLSKQFLITFFTGVAIIAITGIVLYIPQIYAVWNFKGAAYEGRTVLWWGGFWPWIYRDDPTMSNINIMTLLFGSGPGGYRFYFPVFRRPDYFDNQINNVTTFGHNYYLDLLCEFGILGLGFFLALYGKVLLDAFRQVRTTTNVSHRWYQIACICGLVGIAIQNWFSPNNRWAVCGMVYYSLIGLSIGLHHLDRPGEPQVPATGEKRGGQLKLALALFVAVFLFRSTPQGFDYFAAAKANGMGLRYMESAEMYSGQEKERFLERARLLFEEAIRVNPTFVTSYYKLAHVYNTLGYSDPSQSVEYIDKAIKAYEKLQAINPHYSEIHLNLGIMYWAKAAEVAPAERLKLYEMAYREIKEAARQELKPDVQYRASAIGNDYAEALETAGKPDEALKVYEELKTYNRNIVDYQPLLEEYRQKKKDLYPRAMRELIRLAIITDKVHEAMTVVERMYNEDPNSAEALATLLELYKKEDSTERKAKFLDAAVHNSPFDVELRALLAEANLEKGDVQSYEKELRRIEILEPKHRAALGGLYLRYKTSGDEQRAAEYAKKLQGIGISPDSITSATIDAAVPATAAATTSAPLPLSAAAAPVTTMTPAAAAVNSTLTLTTATDEITSPGTSISSK